MRIRVHVLAQTKGLGLKRWQNLLVLWKQARRDMGAIACADVRIAAVQVEPVESRDGVLEQLGVILRVEKRRRLIVVEAVLLLQVWRVVYRRRNVRVAGITASPRPGSTKASHPSPF